MQDHPTVRELLEAVEEFLERDVVTALAGPQQFHARVAANVMRILARELDLAPRQLREEWEGLDRLLGGEPMPASDLDLRIGVTRRSRELCGRIRAGDADGGSRREAVLAHVRRSVEQKLAIAKPDMLRRKEERPPSAR